MFEFILSIIFIIVGLFLLAVTIGVIGSLFPERKSVLEKQIDQLNKEAIEKEEQHQSEINNIKCEYQEKLRQKDYECRQKIEIIQKQCDERLSSYSCNTTTGTTKLDLTLPSEVLVLIKNNLSLKSENESIKKELRILRAEEKRYNSIKKNIQSKRELVKNLSYWSDMATEMTAAASKILPAAFIDRTLFDEYITSMKTMRLSRALREEMRIELPFSLNATVHSHTSQDTYKTSLTECGCADFQNRKMPCKHMIALAIKVRALSPYSIPIHQAVQELCEKVEQITQESEKAENDRKKAGQYKTDCLAIQKIINEKKIYYPWLADLIAQYEMARYQTRQKKSSAQKKAEKEIKRLVKQNARLTNQLLVYEKTFPFLAESKELSPEDFVRQLSQQI